MWSNYRYSHTAINVIMQKQIKLLTSSPPQKPKGIVHTKSGNITLIIMSFSLFLIRCSAKRTKSTLKVLHTTLPSKSNVSNGFK